MFKSHRRRPIAFDGCGQSLTKNVPQAVVASGPGTNQNGDAAERTGDPWHATITQAALHRAVVPLTSTLAI
jgi:hypothetical protein